MNGLKKLHLLLLPIFLSSTVTQVAFASAAPQKTRAHGGFYVELETFNGKSTDSVLSTLPFAATNLFEDEAALTTEANTNHFFKNDYRWGYHIAAGYDFPSCTCCNYGFSLEYTWHKSKDSQQIDGILNSEDIPGLGPVYSFFIDNDIETPSVDASYAFKYHAIDLLGHQNKTFCNCVDVQFFAGARYVRLKEDQQRHFFVPDALFETVLDASEVNDLLTDHEAKFDGIGPRLGVNIFYNLSGGFGLVTEVAGNLLFGRSDSAYSESLTQFTDVGEGEFEIFAGTNKSNEDRHALIVPGFSGKIGLAYHGTCKCSSVSLEIGYRGDKYFNIANHSSLVLITDDAAFIKDGNYHDFDVSGPYLEISFHV